MTKTGKPKRPKKPPSAGAKGGKVVPFPAPQTDEADAELKKAWRSELAALDHEPVGRRCRLSLDKDQGRRLLDFLSATGIDRLVLITESGSRLEIVADRKTITRLVVWRALELGLSFTVEFYDPA